MTLEQHIDQLEKEIAKMQRQISIQSQEIIDLKDACLILEQSNSDQLKTILKAFEAISS